MFQFVCEMQENCQHNSRHTNDNRACSTQWQLSKSAGWSNLKLKSSYHFFLWPRQIYILNPAYCKANAILHCRLVSCHGEQVNDWKPGGILWYRSHSWFWKENAYVKPLCEWWVTENISSSPSQYGETEKMALFNVPRYFTEM